MILGREKRMLSKSALIEERSRKLARVDRHTLKRAWEKNRGNYDHLISIQGVISEHFGWNLGRLINWAKGLGFDGVEIRAETIARYLDQPLPKDTVIGVHLSDKASWTSLWSTDPKKVRWAFGSLAVARAYLGYTSRAGMVESLKAEIETGRGLGARYFVFHASEIDCDSVLSGQLQDDKPVLAAATKLIRELGCPELLIENAPIHEAGAHDSEQLIRLSDSLDHAGLVLDTSHLQVYLFGYQKVAEMTSEVQKIRGQAEIEVVHLSESSLRPSRIHRGQREKDFWKRRALVLESIVDDHLPVGRSIQKPWEILEAAGAPIVTHELKAETFELLEQSLLIQQAYLAGFEI